MKNIIIDLCIFNREHYLFILPIAGTPTTNLLTFIVYMADRVIKFLSDEMKHNFMLTDRIQRVIEGLKPIAKKSEPEDP